ncbi:hypothetical protein ACFQY0_19310 [Haloferula chungangensis]|uniref:DUF3488 domain-containing protein n=1 Tax=Haloferula chungangensis TaxID=1048331 RepID=A0ABW2LDA9_9BACT
MILHLLKTDWQRLRWPILGLWILILLSALPWLLHSPGSFTAPWWTRSGWNGSLPDSAIGPRNSIPPIFNIALSFAALALSATIGMAGIRWQGATPIRPLTQASAKLLALMAFIVLPLLLSGCAVLLIHRFPLATILAAGLGTTTSLVFLHSVSALFGRLCSTGWTWLAGVAALTGLSVIVKQTNLGHGLSIFFSDSWAVGKGPQLWAQCTLALLAMLLFPRLLRASPGQPRAVATGIFSILIAAVVTRSVPVRALIPAPDEVASSALQEIAPDYQQSSLEIEDQGPYGNNGVVKLIIPTTTTGALPPGTSIVWNDDSVPSSGEKSMQHIFPAINSPGDRAAIAPYLPAPLHPLPPGYSRREHVVTYEIPSSELTAKEEFLIPLKGNLFRYDRIVDSPLTENPVSQRSGAYTFSFRQIRSDSRILIELAIQRPMLGASKDPAQLQTPTAETDGFRIFLYSPGDDRCLGLSVELRQSVLIPGGATLIRRVLAPNNDDRNLKLDRSGLRLLIFRPVSLANIKRTLTVVPGDSWHIATDNDWLRFRNYHLGLAAYLQNHRPFRPDPEQATEAEVARYIRTVSATLELNSDGSGPGLSGRDLAEYAPRFSELLTLHARRDTCADSIEFGTPDAQRDLVLKTLQENPSNVYQFAPTLVHRAWTREAIDILIQQLESSLSSSPGYGNTWYRLQALVEAIATLEDPKTYPHLLQALETSNSWAIYDTVRKLPGITPALDESIARMSHDLNPIQVLADGRHDDYFRVFDAFRPGVRHGNPEALEKLLELWRLLPRERFRFGMIRPLANLVQPEPAIPETTEAWIAFLSGKSREDFTYDSLTQKWHAPSTSE